MAAIVKIPPFANSEAGGGGGDSAGDTVARGGGHGGAGDGAGHGAVSGVAGGSAGDGAVDGVAGGGGGGDVKDLPPDTVTVPAAPPGSIDPNESDTSTKLMHRASYPY